MDAFTVITSRRSVRDYSSETISQDIIDKIVFAGTCAPSAYNRQPWEFFVITNRNSLRKISSFDPYASMSKKASFGILVCANLNLESDEGFWVQDCAAATQNIMLATTSFGLGSAWTTIYPFEQVIVAFREFFSLPRHIVPVAFVPVGHLVAGAPIPHKMIRPGSVHQID